MDRKQCEYCIAVYKEVVEKQILDTHKLRKAANIILNVDEDSLIAINRARQVIYGWYNYHRQAFIRELDELFDAVKTVDKTDTVAPDPQTSSHTEDVNYQGIRVNDELDTLKQAVIELEREYELNPNQSNRMKLFHAKKKLL